LAIIDATLADGAEAGYTARMVARIRIGSRGSRLALIQVDLVRSALVRAHPDLGAPGAIEIVVIRTTGDQVQDRRLSEIGGKGLFTKEIETALLDGRIDLGVHSMKDVETVIDDRLTIASMLPRADPRDALIAPRDRALSALPQGAVVGTTSLRRQAQLLRLRPDLKIVTFRGNVETRLRKLTDGDADATLLAVAGLDRLAMSEVITELLTPDIMLPAVGQGAVGMECRREDSGTLALLAPLNDPVTWTCVTAERALLAALDGSCRTPIAAHGTIDGAGRLHLQARLARPDGAKLWETVRAGLPSDGERLGRDAGAELRRQADSDLFG
jgi:hydroxymethylbilane synthase